MATKPKRPRGKRSRNRSGGQIATPKLILTRVRPGAWAGAAARINDAGFRNAWNRVRRGDVT